MSTAKVAQFPLSKRELKILAQKEVLEVAEGKTTREIVEAAQGNPESAIYQYFDMGSSKAIREAAFLHWCSVVRGWLATPEYLCVSFKLPQKRTSDYRHIKIEKVGPVDVRRTLLERIENIQAQMERVEKQAENVEDRRIRSSIVTARKAIQSLIETLSKSLE